MPDQPEYKGKEFYCAVCLNWFNCSRVGAHMQEFHNRPDIFNKRSDQKQWTLERLKEHYTMLGGLDIKDVPKRNEKQEREERFFNVK